MLRSTGLETEGVWEVDLAVSKLEEQRRRRGEMHTGWDQTCTCLEQQREATWI